MMNLTFENYMEMCQQHIILYMRDYAKGLFRTEREFRAALDTDFLLQALDTHKIANVIIKEMGKGVHEGKRMVKS